MVVLINDLYSVICVWNLQFGKYIESEEGIKMAPSANQVQQSGSLMIESKAYKKSILLIFLYTLPFQDLY